MIKGLRDGLIISVLLLIFAFGASSIFLNRNQANLSRGNTQAEQSKAQFFTEKNWQLYDDEYSGFSFYYPSDWQIDLSEKSKGVKKIVHQSCIVKITELDQVSQESFETCNTNSEMKKCEKLQLDSQEVLLQWGGDMRLYASAEIAKQEPEPGAFKFFLEYRSKTCEDQFRNIIKSFSLK